MASLTSPVRALARSRPLSTLSSLNVCIAGPSRLSSFAALSPARASLTTCALPVPPAVPSFRRWNSSSAPTGAAHKALIEETGEAPTEDTGDLRIEAPAPGYKPQPIGQIQPRLSLTFTCTADDCGHRSTHEFSKQAYTKGIVLVQCPECKNRHLIADHLGWFKESTEEGTLKTIEDLLKAKGEKVRTGRVNWDGDIEYDGETKP